MKTLQNWNPNALAQDHIKISRVPGLNTLPLAPRVIGRNRNLSGRGLHTREDVTQAVPYEWCLRLMWKSVREEGEQTFQPKVET